MNETRVIAALYRCDGCGNWWISREVDALNVQLLFQMVEQHKDLFPWEDYSGLRADAEATLCPHCGEEADGPKFSLTQCRQLN
jgi:predicted RNA-binding Zn-ribbon protein involved in translation (DUF1610 family)